MNPYFNNNFFEFFLTLAGRLWDFFTGKPLQLASDELQMLTLILMAISASLVGTFLCFRKMTMLANALSHTTLTAVVVTYLVARGFIAEGGHFDMSYLLARESLLIGAACLMAFITAFGTQFLVRTIAISEDAACGIVFTVLFAVGVMLVTLCSHNAHLGAELVMGSVDALHQDDLLLQCKVTAVILVVIFLFVRPLFVTTFDATFAHTMGLSGSLFAYLIMGLTAIVSVAAFRAVGVLLVLAFFVGPPLIARLWTKHFMRLLFLSTCIGSLASIIAVATSRHMLSVFSLPLSTGALVVMVLATLYVFSGFKIAAFIWCNHTKEGICKFSKKYFVFPHSPRQ